MSLNSQPAPTSAQTRTGHAEARAAAINVADRIATEYPHDLDDVMPKLAGRTVAYDRRARRDLLELLDVLGITPDQIRKTRGTRNA
jgi:hypothetical protein